MTLTLEELWVKAAVEHRLIRFSYMNPETRLVYTKRDVRPVGLGADRHGRPCLWGLLDHNPYVGVKSFQPEFFQNFALTEASFQAEPDGPWKELVPLYDEHKLKEREN